MENLLWSEEEIKVSSDGFLFIVDPKATFLNEEQPLLLHTTLVLLQELYPSREIQAIFSRPGFESEDISEDCAEDGTLPKSDSTSVEEPKSIPQADEKDKIHSDPPEVKSEKATIRAEYKKYQRLDRVENLSNRIHSALQDIRNFRHRIHGARSDPTRENEKIKALQFQQEHLLRVNSEMNGENIDQGERDSKNEVGTPEDGGRNDPDNIQFEDESITVKLARTINSIRALFPHLLPILNHPRRNDKNLVIGKTRYKTKRSGPMCWLLGTESFSSCTLKQVIAAQDDTKHILEAFIDIELASEISKDFKGSPLYWSTSWIEHVVKRSNPAVPSPMKVLAAKSDKSEADIRHAACSCDIIISARENASTQGLDQQYKRAVRKIHQRLSNVLTSRFHGARVSVYCITDSGSFSLFGSYSISPL